MLPRDFGSTVQRTFISGGTRHLGRGPATAGRGARGRGPARPARRPASSTVREESAVSGLRRRKESQGRKRHILTDTGGLLVAVVVHGGEIQDRDGAPAVFAAIPRHFRLRHVFADGAYAGPARGRTEADPAGPLEIVHRPAGVKGFQLLADGSSSARSPESKPAAGQGLRDGHRDRRSGSSASSSSRAASQEPENLDHFELSGRSAIAS